jgi:hypothetical protein
MVHAPTWRRLESNAALFSGLRAGARFVAILLVLCGLAVSSLHVHHGSGSETCAVCVHARTPAETTPTAALLIPLQPTDEARWSTNVPFAPTPRTESADSRAPPRPAPTA